MNLSTLIQASTPICGLGVKVYKMLRTMFGSGSLKDTKEFIQMIMDGFNSVFSNQAFIDAVSVLKTLGFALIIVYFSMDLIENFQRQSLTYEKTLVAFVKMLIALWLIVYSTDITYGLLDLTKATYTQAAKTFDEGVVGSDSVLENDKKKTLSFFGIKGKFPDLSKKVDPKTPFKNGKTYKEYLEGDTVWTKFTSSLKKAARVSKFMLQFAFDDTDEEKAADAQKAYYEAIGSPKSEIYTVENYMENLYEVDFKNLDQTAITFIFTIIMSIAMAIAELGLNLAVISNSIMVLVKGMFLPVAVANSFEDGSRSAGIRYIKKFAASLLTFVIILAIIYGIQLMQYGITTSFVRSSLQGYIGNSKYIDLSGDTLLDFTSDIKAMGMCALFRFSAMGLAAKASSIANDVFGV